MTATRKAPDPFAKGVDWHQVLDALEEPVLIVDAEERVVDVNRAALRELHCSPERARELSLTDLHQEPWRGCRSLARVVRMRGSERERTLRETRSGRHWSIQCRFLSAEESAEALETKPANGEVPDDRLLLLVLRETTEFHLLRGAMRQYEKSMWLADVVGGLAHQVNNPLFAISSTLDWLQQPGVEVAARAESVVALQREVAKISDLMRSFVEFSTASCRQRGRHDLVAVVEEACFVCNLDGSESGLRVELQVEAGVEALVDRQAMVLALAKLLENSRDLSPENGTIWISGRRVSPAGGSDAAAPAAFELRIRDQGPGIPPAYRRQVFEPFFSRRPGHHGLGLALAERILVAHGGSMVCEGSHEGASIVLRLPVANSRSDKAEAGGWPVF